MEGNIEKELICLGDYKFNSMLVTDAQKMMVNV